MPRRWRFEGFDCHQVYLRPFCVFHGSVQTTRFCGVTLILAFKANRSCSPSYRLRIQPHARSSLNGAPAYVARSTLPADPQPDILGSTRVRRLMGLGSLE